MLEIKVTIGLEPKVAELLSAYIALNKTTTVGVEEPQKALPAKVDKDPSPKTANVPQTPKKGEEPGPKTTDVPPPPQKSQEPKALDIEDVRGILAEAKHSHGLPKIKPILKKYGAGDLASVPADRYAELVADIEALGD